MNIKTKIARTVSAAFTFAILLLSALSVNAQNASPLGGVGSLQFFDNSGAPLVSGVVYIYNAGTSTQATVYTDTTGTTTQPNPVTFGSGARAAIWLANGTFVKVVLCIQNDGAFCSAGDILFSADQVPIGSTSSGGGGSPFTGIFISSTASPATSGTLRLASGDSVCWRNAAGSANLCFKKDSNDLLSWDGGSFKLPEVGAPAGVAGFDILWADNTAHRLKAVNNAGTAAQYVLSGNDIDTTDAVKQVHFGASAAPIGNILPSTNQFLQWSGTSIVGATVTQGYTVTPADLTAQGGSVGPTTLVTPGANGFYRATCFVVMTRAATTSSTLPNCFVNFTDPDSNSSQTIGISVSNTNNVIPDIGQQTLVGGFFAKSGVAISYQTTGYTSVGATSMQYAIHLRLEGPF